MVTFKLVEKRAEHLVYWYYLRKGNEALRPGIIEGGWGNEITVMELGRRLGTGYFHRKNSMKWRRLSIQMKRERGATDLVGTGNETRNTIFTGTMQSKNLQNI